MITRNRYSSKSFDRDCNYYFSGRETTVIDLCKSLGIDRYACSVLGDSTLQETFITYEEFYPVWKDATYLRRSIPSHSELGAFLSLLYLGTETPQRVIAAQKKPNMGIRHCITLSASAIESGAFSTGCNVNALKLKTPSSESKKYLYQGYPLTIPEISKLSGTSTQFIYSTLRRYPKFETDDLYHFLSELYLYRGQELSMEGILRLTGVKVNAFRAVRNRESFIFGDDVTAAVDRLVLDARARLKKKKSSAAKPVT